MAPEAGMAILAGAGGLMKSVGQYQQMRSAAELEALEEALARRAADEATAAASYEAAQIARMGERLAGRQRALYAKAGVEFAGTPLEVMEQTAADVEQDVLIRLRMGQQQRQALLLEAKSRKRRRKGIVKAMPWTIGSTLLTGFRPGMKYGLNWLQGRKMKTTYGGAGYSSLYGAGGPALKLTP